jgi:hypothetical protein
MADMSQVYDDAVAAIAAVATGLTGDQLRQHVPATPAWTVHDVLAHLAGGPADAVAGRMEGAPAPEWSAMHVGERAGTPVTHLLEEMRGNVAAIQRTLPGNPRPAIAWDASVHLAFLHEALGLGRPPEQLWQPVLAGAAPHLLGDREVDVDDYELFRGLFSRRSRSQMRAWGTPLSPEELDELPVFGPRDDDQPIPEA